MPQAAKTQNCNSVAQDQDDSALMMGGYRALALTLYYLGDFKFARQCAMRGVQIWRSEMIQSCRRGHRAGRILSGL
jgi:hypothetical protein